jgi:nucleoside-diphosphate-sugar epimerase
MLIALTGATGGVGQALVRAALAEGYTIRALVRDAKRAASLAARGVALVEGDLENPAALEETARGADVFVHTAAHVGDAGPREEFERVNVGGTRNAVEAAARAGVKRFVHVSSVAVYGRPDRGNIDESYAPRPCGTPYEDTKYEAERVAFERGRALGLEVSAVRPPVIYGPDDRVFLPRAIKTLRKRLALYIDGGRAPLNVVNVDDVAEVILRCATRAEAVGEAFNVAANPPPTVRQVLETIAEVAGAPLPRVSLPYKVAMVLATALDTGWKLARAKGSAPLTPFVVTLMTRHVVYDASKARRLLGWNGGGDPLASIREAARIHAAA